MKFNLEFLSCDLSDRSVLPYRERRDTGKRVCATKAASYVVVQVKTSWRNICHELDVIYKIYIVRFNSVS